LAPANSRTAHDHRQITHDRRAPSPARALLCIAVMTSVNGLPLRARCSSHGLILDDEGRCSRCVRESATQGARSPLARLVMIALVVVVGFALYRIGSASYDALTSARTARSSAHAQVSAGAQVSSGSRLVVYTSAGCGACRIAKKWMNENSVTYEERSIDNDAGARKELASLGKGVVVPTFVVDGDEVLTGFDVRGVRLTRALQKHGIAH
jgi:glutaredoxin